MKRDIVHLVYSLVVLVVSCTVEECIPGIFGVGVPVLLAAAIYCAINRKPVEGVLFALAAGAAEDSLASLPLAASVSFFVIVSAIIRGFKLPSPVAFVVYPLYQFWVWIWLGSAIEGNILLRILAAFPVGAITVCLVWAFLRWFDGKAALNEK